MFTADVSRLFGAKLSFECEVTHTSRHKYCHASCREGGQANFVVGPQF